VAGVRSFSEHNSMNGYFYFYFYTKEKKRFLGVITELHQQAYEITGSGSRNDYNSSVSSTLGAQVCCLTSHRQTRLESSTLKEYHIFLMRYFADTNLLFQI
jgi:hypothetical protein